MDAVGAFVNTSANCLSGTDVRDLVAQPLSDRLRRLSSHDIRFCHQPVEIRGNRCHITRRRRSGA